MFVSVPRSETCSRMKLCLLVTVILIVHTSAYVPPQATVQPLHPIGVRLSIPDEEGISLVAFHVKFNEEFQGLEAGTIARDIVSVRNGRWTYEDRSTKLKKGDIIYYWVHVIYKGLGYNLLEQQHRVNVLYNYDGIPVTSNQQEEAVCLTPSETTWTSGRYEPQQIACPGQLIFNEPFDSFNSSRWSIVERFSGAPSYEFVVYRNSNENVKVENGNLRIIPTKLDDTYGADFTQTGTLVLNKCTGQTGTQECKVEARGSYILPPIISGRINTRNSFTFLYGRVQVRAKLPRGDWLYPLISLESVENSSSGTKSELRVALAYGNTNLRSEHGTEFGGRILAAGGVSTCPPSQAGNNIHADRSQLPRRQSSDLWSDDFHLYELEWRRDTIIVKVDGVKYGEHNGGEPFNKPCYLTLGLAAGGHTEFPDGALSNSYTKPWRNVGAKALFDFYNARENWLSSWEGSATNLEVDYVKVYAL